MFVTVRVIRSWMTRLGTVEDEADILWALQSIPNKTWSQSSPGHVKLLDVTCRIGYVGIVKYVLQKAKFERLPAQLLWTACTAGHTDIVAFFLQTFKVTRHTSAILLLNCLDIASSHNRIDLVRYLCESFGLSRRTCRQKGNHSAFRIACKSGCLEVVKYLHGHLRLTRKDVCSNHNIAIVAACERDYIEVLSYLCEALPLTVSDLGSDVNLVLAAALRSMSKDVIRYLHRHFKLVRMDWSQCFALTNSNQQSMEDWLEFLD